MTGVIPGRGGDNSSSSRVCNSHGAGGAVEEDGGVLDKVAGLLSHVLSEGEIVVAAAGGDIADANPFSRKSIVRTKRSLSNDKENTSADGRHEVDRASYGDTVICWSSSRPRRSSAPCRPRRVTRCSARRRFSFNRHCLICLRDLDDGREALLVLWRSAVGAVLADTQVCDFMKKSLLSSHSLAASFIIG